MVWKDERGTYDALKVEGMVLKAALNPSTGCTVLKLHEG